MATIKSIEEKAKAYDEAVINGSRLWECDKITREDYEFIFPTLKKSEDERIMENIIATIHLYYGEPLEDEAKEMIAWLEKQGEQKSTLPKWKYKKDNTPLLRDSLILNKYGCVAKAPSSAIVSDVWVIDYDELVKLPKEEIENQVEQKPADKVEPKFHEGEWITNGDYTWKILEVKPLDYILQSQDGNIVDDTISHVDEHFHSFTIEDAKDGDALAFKNNIGGIIICKSPSDYDTRSYCRLIRNNLINKEESGWDSTLLVPATKEQRDLLFKKMEESGYEFDFETKELKEIEQKASWSEEDETGLGDALWAIQQAKTIAKDENDMGNIWYAKNWLKSIKDRVQPQHEWNKEDENTISEAEVWLDTLCDYLKNSSSAYIPNVRVVISNLKSLKDRYTWKPSDEQMDALRYVTNFDYGGHKATLVSLYEQLKKLK